MSFIDEIFTESINERAQKNESMDKIIDTIDAEPDVQTMTREEFIEDVKKKYALAVDVIVYVSGDDDTRNKVISEQIYDGIMHTHADMSTVYVEHLVSKRSDAIKYFTKDDSEYTYKTRLTFGIDFKQDVNKFLNFCALMYAYDANLTATTFVFLHSDDPRLIEPSTKSTNHYDEKDNFSKVHYPYKLKFMNCKELDAECCRTVFKEHFFKELWFFEETEENKQKIDKFFEKYGKNRKVYNDQNESLRF